MCVKYQYVYTVRYFPYFRPMVIHPGRSVSTVKYRPTVYENRKEKENWRNDLTILYNFAYTEDCILIIFLFPFHCLTWNRKPGENTWKNCSFSSLISCKNVFFFIVLGSLSGTYRREVVMPETSFFGQWFIWKQSFIRSVLVTLIIFYFTEEFPLE